MASVQVQNAWCGTSGLALYRQTAAFMRIIAYNYAKYLNKGLDGASIMDFGVGFGRMLRMFYYWTDPENLWGIDAWQKSLDHCSKCNLPGNFALSESRPKSLPVEGGLKFNLIVSYSVFTHLAPETGRICLSTLRQHIAADGLLILTFRPSEFWKFIDQIRGTNFSPWLEEEHRRVGLAYLPHKGKEGDDYGDISMLPSFFETDDWTCLSVDRGIDDTYQLIGVLAPK
jgi:hypothetical protein